MFIIYDIITLLIIVFYLPVYLLKGKFHKGFLARLGILPKGLNLAGAVWIHAVSLGEAVSVRGIYEGVKKEFSSKRAVFSTVTLTGNKIAKSYCQAGDFVTFLPLDFSFLVRNFIKRVRPSVFIAAETEIWPNLISYLFQEKVPVIVVNARISDSSFRGYMLVRMLIKPILNKVTLFCAQSEEDARRLIILGVEDKKIKVTGNIKFDAAKSLPSDFNVQNYRKKLGLAKEDKVFVAASTHSPEEEQILSVYKDLVGDLSNLKLILAPRHPERFSEISVLVKKYGFNPVSINSLEGKQHAISKGDIFILDFIGQLVYYYAIADVVFVGGSLAKKGGHNILEPAAQGKPVIFGPNMFNFRDITDLFIKNHAGIQVKGSDELRNKIKILFKKPELAAGLCRSADALILRNKGATLRNLEYIKEYVKH